MKGWMHFVVYYFSIENASAGKLSLVVFIPLDSQEHNKELETSGESKVMIGWWTLASFLMVVSHSLSFKN